MTKYISTILIVDDDLIECKMMEALLRSADYQILFVTAGKHALPTARQTPPDLVLLDVLMPELDGFEICQQLRDDPILAEVPIIMVTALEDRESRMRGMDAGADDFLIKPFDPIELRARVRTITRLNRYRLLLNERTQRQQAEEQIRQRSRDLTLLNRVIATAASTLDVEEALHTACKALAYAFDLPQATATLLNAEQTECTIVSEYPFIARLQDGQLSLKSSETSGWLSALGSVIPVATIPTMAHVLAHKTPLLVADAQHDPQLERLHALLRERGIVTLMSVPILVRDQVAGTIELSTTEPRVFSEQDIALAQSVAIAAGHAMEAARLHQQLRQHAASLEEIVTLRTLELQIERDHTRSILEAVGEAVVVASLDGAIQYVNPAAIALAGYSAQEMLGQSWYMWQGDHASPQAYAQIQETIGAGRIWQGEMINRRKGGTLYSTALTAAPLFDPDDQERTSGFVIVQRDITLLKEAERLKDQFVSNVSHELRTPLSVITLLSGNLDTLYERLDDPQRRGITRDIRAQARVLNELITDVLEISRLDSASVPAEYRRINVAQLAAEELEKQLPLAHKKSQITRMVGIDRLEVYGNEGQLRQVIRNLINNAIKYTPADGQITCTCRVVIIQPAVNHERSFDATQPGRRGSDADGRPEAWPGRDNLPAGRWAAVMISDNGSGFGEHELLRIFERFYRVKTEGNIPGTGLGLSIARDLVALHGGQIAVASIASVGSNFVVYIPAIEDADHDHDSGS
ncbi:MAG: response regulator [Roseiflexaceae bacterium]